jgi:hypothetical protein
MTAGGEPLPARAPAARCAGRSAVSRRGVPGLVYLLHLERPYKHARHYTGFAEGGPKGLARRLAEHGTTHGSPLLAAAKATGITWQLARTWPGTRARERQLKRQGGASRRCTLCGIVPRPGELPRNADGSISRSLTSDPQKDAAGLMTAAQQAEHTALRHGAGRGRVARAVRMASTPSADLWYQALPAAG